MSNKWNKTSTNAINVLVEEHFSNYSVNQI